MTVTATTMGTNILASQLGDRTATGLPWNSGQADAGQADFRSEASPVAPAVAVTLSERAKVILAKANADQKVADRLDQIVSATRGRGQGQATSLNKAGADIMAKYGDLPGAGQWAANASADTIGLLKAGLNGFDLPRIEGFARTMQAGGEVRLGQETMSEDEQFVQSIQLRLANQIVSLEKSGQDEQAQALRGAIRSGTVQVRKADDVPDLNLNYSVSHFADAGGGGTTSSWNWNPTGDAKAALDGGRAITVGGVDRGAFFISW